MRCVVVESCMLAMALSVLLSRQPDGGSRSSPAQASDPLRTEVSAFRVEGATKLDALLRLGKQEHLPLGIEYLDRDSVQTKTPVDLKGLTVGQVLGVVLGRGIGYRWQVDNGVINITHRRVSADARRNLFERRLRDFNIQRVPLQQASLNLLIALMLTLNPHASNIFGDYPGGNIQNKVGPLRMDNATVRQILNCLVSEARDAAWVVQVSPGYLDQLPSAGLWRIVDYNDSGIMTNAGEFFRGLIFETF